MLLRKIMKRQRESKKIFLFNIADYAVIYKYYYCLNEWFKHKPSIKNYEHMFVMSKKESIVKYVALGSWQDLI